MSDLFLRHRATTRSKEVRRLVLGLAGLLAAGVVWYLPLRPIAVDLLARSSLGCEARRLLIAAALVQRYPEQSVSIDSVVSNCAPWPATVTWAVTDDAPAGIALQPTQTHVLADARLDRLGSFRSYEWTLYLVPPHADRDRDGRLELTCQQRAVVFRDRRFMIAPPGYAVIRVGEQSNEIAGLIATWDHPGRGTAQYVLWQDQDGDGLDELLVRRQTGTSRAGLTRLWGTPETVAVLEWNHPGGVLRPRYLREDTGLAVWSPPDGNPYGFPTDAVVNDILRELLPPPPDWPEMP